MSAFSLCGPILNYIVGAMEVVNYVFLIFYKGYIVLYIFKACLCHHRQALNIMYVIMPVIVCNLLQSFK